MKEIEEGNGRKKRKGQIDEGKGNRRRKIRNEIKGETRSNNYTKMNRFFINCTHYSTTPFKKNTFKMTFSHGVL